VHLERLVRFSSRGRSTSLCVLLLTAMALVTGCAGRAGGADDALAQPGAGGPSLRIADDELARAPRTVSGAEAAADLDRAVYVFDQAYAGVEGRTRMPSEPRVAKLRAKLAERPEWPAIELAAELRDLFQQPDGHLAFGVEGSDARWLMAWPRRAPVVSAPLFDRLDAAGDAWIGARRLGGCSGPEDARALLPTPDGRWVLGVFGEAPAWQTASTAGAAALSCTMVDDSGTLPLSLELNESPTAARTPQQPQVSFDEGPVPVLTLRSFDNRSVAALRELPAIAARLRRASGFVVDLRGNGGGNYSFAEAFLLALTDRELMRLEEREVVSVAAAEGRANAVRRRMVSGNVPEAALPHFTRHLEALEAEASALRERGAARTELHTRGASVRGHAPGPLRARGVLLVDGGCASACEMLVSLARQVPGLVVAGQNTRGGMAVGEVALYRLPSSGVVISLGTRAFRDPLGDFDETRGFLPDVWIDAARETGRADAALAAAKTIALEGAPADGRLALRRAAARRAAAPAGARTETAASAPH
jgi:hypothetical protein